MLEASKHYARVNELFQAAVDLPAAERASLLERECGGDDALRREVESFLAADARSDGFIEEPLLAFPADLISDDDEGSFVGREIGPYRITREIGRGGLGAVYLAARADDEYRKEVAIKLIRRGLDTDDILQRFRNERQILAQLDHPNIAHLLDGGTTQDGLPYFVMEYVQGEPIDRYCTERRLSIADRLKLFRKVCAAVTYAHQNLVIHRDLKPSNILVTKDGEPKLLDFGIAKLLATEGESFTLTMPAQRVMTPDYASPEQVRGEKITTASDVYSLGVLLYELLCGRKPYRLKTGTNDEMSRAITEQEAPRPSTVTSGEGTRLRGDLDNIVLMALRKEPARRYSSAENFARDIDRYQEGRPVTARAQTFSYRAGKFITRNRAAVVASVLILLAIVSGIAAALWQARVADVERDRARLEAQKARKVNEFMRNVLNFSNPVWVSSNPKRNREATISDALDEARKKIDTDLANEPDIQAEILFTIGTTFSGQAQYDKAMPPLREAVEKFDRVFGKDNRKSVEASSAIATVLYLTGKHNEAEEIYHRTLSFYRSHPPQNEDQVRLFVIELNDYANIQNYKSNFTEAEQSYREALERGQNLTGKNRGMMPSLMGNLAWLLHSKGRFDEALSYYDQAQQELHAGGNEDKLEAGTLFNKIGVAYTEMGKYRDAEPYYQRSFEVLMKTLGAENFYTVSTMYRNAYNFYKQDKLEDAEQLVNQSLEIQHKLFPNGHNVTAYSERLLGEIATRRGQLKKGEELLRKALADLLKKNKEPSRDIALAKLSLGENLIAQERFPDAEPLISSALEGSMSLVGDKHPFTQQCRAILSRIPK
jgi:serine/threonine-protein kinase